MAFVDVILKETDATITMVDRRIGSSIASPSPEERKTTVESSCRTVPTSKRGRPRLVI
jgi:hypothetical protein